MFLKVSTASSYKPVIINVAQVVDIDGSIVTMSNGKIHDLMSDSLRELTAIALPVKRTAKSTEPKSELNDLFDELHKLTGGKGNAVFTLQREKKLSDLLTKHRLTKENLITAATNIGKDDFLQGRDPANEAKKRYGDVDYLLRPDKAAKWSEEIQQKKKGMF